MSGMTRGWDGEAGGWNYVSKSANLALSGRSGVCRLSEDQARDLGH